MSHSYQHDVLVIGSGAAGLALALQLPAECRIALICKNDLNEGSTYYAQGGIAAVMDDNDSIQSHIDDTLSAGAGLCQVDAVRFTVENSRKAVQWLIDQGVQFSPGEDQAEGEYHLTREGGHSRRRVLHAADATGKAISQVLIERALAAANIDIFSQRVAVDLVQSAGRCQGAYVLDRQRDKIDYYGASATVLASGGASKAYLYTSNPDGASGDGIAMAWRLGCRVANLEFNQFHPTCLYHPGAKSFLITEALRGEGGLLRLANGERFMHKFDERGELAPRDIVARAIDHEMKRLGQNCVYLDISHRPRSYLEEHFPNVMARCLEFGFDIATDPIPVVPAAHYTCGGVVVNTSGQTDIAGLYAIGETSCTGLHGANRMASNSLLECLVYAHSAAAHIKENLTGNAQPYIAEPWDETRVTDSDEDVVISHNWDELRRFMWDYVGIVRTDKRLARASHRIDLLQSEIREYYSNYKVSNDLLELRNLTMVADLMIQCARLRRESRGLHYTLDYPDTNPEAVDTILNPDLTSSATH
ncbi:MAG: L-aspartate oxidase [Halieaceae bacterium]|jgi:L-aspartate oxidase